MNNVESGLFSADGKYISGNLLGNFIRNLPDLTRILDLNNVSLYLNWIEGKLILGAAFLAAKPGGRMNKLIYLEQIEGVISFNLLKSFYSHLETALNSDGSEIRDTVFIEYLNAVNTADQIPIEIDEFKQAIGRCIGRLIAAKQTIYHTRDKIYGLYFLSIIGNRLQNNFKIPAGTLILAETHVSSMGDVQVINTDSAALTDRSICLLDKFTIPPQLELFYSELVKAAKMMPPEKKIVPKPSPLKTQYRPRPVITKTQQNLKLPLIRYPADVSVRENDIKNFVLAYLKQSTINKRDLRIYLGSEGFPLPPEVENNPNGSMESNKEKAIRRKKELIQKVNRILFIVVLILMVIVIVLVILRIFFPNVLYEAIRNIMDIFNFETLNLTQNNEISVGEIVGEVISE